MANVSSTPSPDTTNELKQKCNDIMSKHTALNAEFNKLNSATPETTFGGWTKFVADVDTAYSEIKAVIALLDADKAKQSKEEQTSAPEAGKENINKKIFEEYAEFYDAIGGALMESDGKIKSAVNTKYDALLQSIMPDKGDSVKKNFAEAIKNNSLNKSAITIRPFESENKNDINYDLLKVILTQLSPNNIKEKVKLENPEDKSLTLDNLLAEIIRMLNTPSTELWKKISAEYAKTVPQGGGGSSSSLSTSKKNRKSHKSYHTSIGKTKKHHRGNNNKISFVH